MKVLVNDQTRELTCKDFVEGKGYGPDQAQDIINGDIPFDKDKEAYVATEEQYDFWKEMLSLMEENMEMSKKLDRQEYQKVLDTLPDFDFDVVVKEENTLLKEKIAKKMTPKDEECNEEIRKELADIKSILSEILAAQSTMEGKKDPKQDKSLQDMANIFFKQADQIRGTAKKILDPEKKNQYLGNALSKLHEVKEAIKKFPVKIAESIKEKSFNIIDKALNSAAAKLDDGAKYLQKERDRVISMSPIEKTTGINTAEKTDFYASYIESDSVEKRYIANYKNNEKFFYRQEDADKQFIADELKFHGSGLKESKQILQRNSPNAENNPAYAKEITIAFIKSSIYKELSYTQHKEPEMSR